MPKLDAYEQEVLKAFEGGKLKSVATRSELDKLKAAARATAIKDRSLVDKPSRLAPRTSTATRKRAAR